MDAQHPQAQAQAQAQTQMQDVQQAQQGQQPQLTQQAQHAQHAQQAQQQQQQFGNTLKSDKDLLHGYIYDYLIKQKLPESAKVFFKEAEVVSNGKTTTVIMGKPASPENDENPANGVSNASSNSSTPRPFSNQDAKKTNGTGRLVSIVLFVMCFILIL